MAAVMTAVAAGDGFRETAKMTVMTDAAETANTSYPATWWSAAACTTTGRAMSSRGNHPAAELRDGLCRRERAPIPVRGTTTSWTAVSALHRRSLLDQFTPSGALVNTLEVPNSSQHGGPPKKDQMVTSFSSKSELR